MTPGGFRTLALSLPETAESQHVTHPDFRRAGKVVATLGAAARTADVRAVLELAWTNAAPQPRPARRPA